MIGTHPFPRSGRAPLAPVEGDAHASAEILCDRLRRLLRLAEAFSSCAGPEEVRRAVPGILGVIPAAMVRVVESSPAGCVATAAWPEAARDLPAGAHAAAPAHDALARGTPVWLETRQAVAASVELAAVATALGVEAWGAIPISAGKTVLELGLPAAPRLDATERGYLSVAASIVGAALLGASSADRAERSAELEREAQRASAELTAAFEGLAAGLVIATPAGELVCMNHAAMDLLAIDDLERQGIRTVGDVLDHGVVEWPDGRRVRMPATPFARARKGEIVRDVLVRFVPPAQPRRWIRASAVPLGAPGAVHHVVLSLVDVTRARELEQEQRDLVREIFDELAPSVRAVRQIARRIDGAGNGSRDAKDATRDIFRHARRMEAAMRELEDAIRVDSSALVPSRELVDVKAFVLDLLERLAADVETGRMVVSVPPGLPSAHVDPEHLERILVELIRGAHAGAAGGAEIAVACASVRGAVRIKVTSKGQDIAPEDLPRIFDRFFRARGRPAGRLYLVRLLAEANGGRVMVEGGEGGALAIEVELPSRGG